MADEAEIPKYYAGKKILVTGGTGCMGKMLIWKLLQSCSLLDTIYVLVRSKQGKTPKSRKDELFRNMMFDEFINDNSKVLEKVVFIAGDVGEEGVGLSQHDRNILINGVSHVFHGAAILKMDADLKCAINVNTEGTLRMLQLAGQMKKLEAFVYISTAYCCCENKLVEEKLYPSKHNPYEVIRLVHWMDAELLEIITPKLIDPLPNTYTYSKRLTESIFPDFESKIPILIVARPTIVVPSLKEPVPGWDDNWNGPTGLFVAGGKGVLRMTTMKRQGKPNMVPVDIAINGIITLPWAHAKENPNGVIKSPQKVNVYNVGETEHSSHTWEELIEMGFRSAFKYPFQYMLWYPNRYNIFEDNFLVYKIKALFLHWLPAYVIDFIMVIMAQKPFLVRVCSKMQSGEKVLRYFGRREWTFANDKLLRIKDKMNDADKAIFPITMKALIDSQAFMDKAILFTRQYLCKENPNTIHSSKKKLKMLYLLDRFFLVVRYILLVKILMRMYYLFVRLIGDYQYQPHMKT